MRLNTKSLFLVIAQILLLYFLPFLFSCNNTFTSTEPKLYTISIAKNIQNGTVRANKESCDAGEIVTLTVSPNDGFKLHTISVLDSSGNTIPLDNNVFIMPKSNVVITAIFIASTAYYSITVNSEIQNGIITVSKTKAIAGERITVSISPNDGYVLSSLNVSDSNSNIIIVTNNTFTMPGCNVTINASFIQAVTYYSITLNSVINGEIASNKTTATLGETVTLTVSPNEGFELDNLSVKDSDGHSITLTNNSFSMPESNVTVSASFKVAITYYSITINSNENGSVTSGKTSATAGEIITLTISPNEGFELDTLSVKDSDGNSITLTNNSFSMPESNVTIAVIFSVAVTYYSVTINPCTNGLVSVDKTNITSGETVTLSISPDNNYILATLTIVDASGHTITVTNNAFTMPESNVAISASFKLNANYLTFITYCSIQVATQTVSMGNRPTVVTMSDNSECEGFLGWYTDETFTTLFDFTTTLEKDTEIFAKWSSFNVTKDTICDVIQNLKYSCLIKANGDFSTSNIQKVNVALKYLYSINPDIEVSLNLANITDLLTLENASTKNTTNSFYACSNLISIVLPNCLQTIGSYAFYNNTKLSSVTLTSNTNTIATDSFEGCNARPVVNYSGTLSQWCMSSLSGLKSKMGNFFINGESLPDILTIPPEITRIDGYSFNGCHFSHLIIPETVTDFDYFALLYAEISEITFPGSITTNFLMSGCKDLKVNFTGSLTQWCMASMANLKTRMGSFTINGEQITGDLVIPPDVTTIDDYSFKNCSSITSLTIPNNVTSIAKHAFKGCSSIKTITISHGDLIQQMFESGAPSCVKKVVVTDSLDDGAFEDCTYIEEVVLPSGITTIGKNTFRQCRSLKGIVIPHSVTSIGEYAFDYCTSLTGIDIPDSVTSIGKGAFMNCNNLAQISLSGSTSIDSNAFAESGNCIVNFRGTISQWCSSSGLYDLKKNKTNLYLYGEELAGEISIPEDITSITAYTFSNCTGITNISLPNSVRNIESSAFRNCSNHIEIKMSDNINDIGSYAFYGCSSIQEIIIPNNVTSINTYSFYGCSNLETITIGSGVTIIKEYAFSGCSGLKNINFVKTIPWFIKDPVTELGTSITVKQLTKLYEKKCIYNYDHPVQY